MRKFVVFRLKGPSYDIRKALKTLREKTGASFPADIIRPLPDGSASYSATLQYGGDIEKLLAFDNISAEAFVHEDVTGIGSYSHLVVASGMTAVKEMYRSFTAFVDEYESYDDILREASPFLIALRKAPTAESLRDFEKDGVISISLTPDGFGRFSD